MPLSGIAVIPNRGRSSINHEKSDFETFHVLPQSAKLALYHEYLVSGQNVHLKTEKADRHTSIRFQYRYAVFGCSFSVAFFAALRSFCFLRWCSYWQSPEQNFTFDLVVVKVLPQFSQTHSRLLLSAASCR